MYDIYQPPFTIEIEDTLITVEKQGSDLVYKRMGNVEEEKELVLLNNDGNIVINPIEPVNLPEKITSHLLVDLKNPVFIRPNDKKDISDIPGGNRGFCC